ASRSVAINRGRPALSQATAVSLPTLSIAVTATTGRRNSAAAIESARFNHTPPAVATNTRARIKTAAICIGRPCAGRRTGAGAGASWAVAVAGAAAGDAVGARDGASGPAAT